MRDQGVERNTRLNVEVTRYNESPRSLVSTVELELVRTIVRKTSVRVSQQARQVEQRCDVRVCLAVVIAEEAFVVTDQARENIRRHERVVVCEPSTKREFQTAIETSSTAKALMEINAGLILGVSVYTTRSRRKRLARIEQEVCITVIERTVFDNRSLCTVDTASSEREIAHELMLESGGKFVDRLRLQTDVDRSRISTQVSRVEVGRDRRVQRSAVAVHVEVLVGLTSATTRADIEIQRDRRFDEPCIVGEDLRSSLAHRIP